MKERASNLMEFSNFQFTASSVPLFMLVAECNLCPVRAQTFCHWLVVPYAVSELARVHLEVLICLVPLPSNLPNCGMRECWTHCGRDDDRHGCGVRENPSAARQCVGAVHVVTIERTVHHATHRTTAIYTAARGAVVASPATCHECAAHRGAAA